MCPDFQIRLFEERDEPGVTALWEEVLPSSKPWREPQVVIRRKQKENDGLFFVGESDGRIVSTVMAGYDGVRGWIYVLAVAPDCRHRGFGRQMVSRAEQALRSRGCPKLNLQVRATNTGVVAFYEKLGFSIDGHVSMGKPLLAGEEPALPDPIPTLELDGGYELSQIQLSDKAAYLKHLNETDQISRYLLTMRFPYTEADADEWLALVQTQTLEANHSRVWAIREPSGELIGGIGLANVSDGQSAEIGYWLAKSYWGKGVMATAARRVCEYGFSEFKLSKIRAIVFDGNSQSERVLQRTGFEKEGFLRRHVFRDGVPIDVHFYGLLSE